MVLRRPLILLSVLLVGLVTVIVVASPRQPVAGPEATASLRPSASTAVPVQRVFDDVDVSATFVGPSYSTDVVRAPTRDKPQSKLWFHDGLWWGVLYDEATSEFHIWWLDRTADAWVDTGVFVDSRPYARQDVVTQGDDVLIVSGGSRETSAHHALVALSYRYNSDRRIYELGSGFPAPITSSGTDAPNVAIDVAGRAWVTYIYRNQVWVVTSDEAKSAWSAPLVVPSEHSTVAADQAAITATATGVAVMWSNQNDEAVYFAEHRDGDPLSEWSPTEPALAGTLAADDHISLRALVEDGETRIFAVVKTSLDNAPNPNQQAPQIVLIERTPQGDWRRYLVGRIEDHHTRPILAIDAEQRELYIFATSPFDGGEVYLKRASVDHIVFVDGLGQPVLVGENVPHINNATTARQPLDGDSGVVILAADDTDGAYRFAEIGGARGAAPAGAVDEQVIFNQTFDGLSPANDILRTGWQPTGDGAQLLVEGGALQLTSTSGASVRGCASVAPQASGWVQVTARARLAGTPTRDAAIVAVRGDGAEFTGLRFQPNGAIAAMSGDDRTGELGLWAPGAWYVITLRVDWPAQSWSFSVVDDTGATVAAMADLAWQRAVPAADEVCAQLPASGVGTIVELDAVTVERSRGAE